MDTKIAFPLTLQINAGFVEKQEHTEKQVAPITNSQTFGLTLVPLNIREESTPYKIAIDAVTTHLKKLAPTRNGLKNQNSVSYCLPVKHAMYDGAMGTIIQDFGKTCARRR